MSPLNESVKSCSPFLDNWSFPLKNQFTVLHCPLNWFAVNSVKLCAKVYMFASPLFISDFLLYLI